MKPTSVPEALLLTLFPHFSELVSVDVTVTYRALENTARSWVVIQRAFKTRMVQIQLRNCSWPSSPPCPPPGQLLPPPSGQMVRSSWCVWGGPACSGSYLSTAGGTWPPPAGSTLSVAGDHAPLGRPRPPGSTTNKTFQGFFIVKIKRFPRTIQLEQKCPMRYFTKPIVGFDFVLLLNLLTAVVVNVVDWAHLCTAKAHPYLKWLFQTRGKGLRIYDQYTFTVCRSLDMTDNCSLYSF